MRRLILCLLAVTAMGSLVTAVPSSKEEAKRAEVLVLGTYHMSNPGRDIFNMQADDALSPKRQQEIAELAAVLKKFKPTKVAVEADYGTDAVPKRSDSFPQPSSDGLPEGLLDQPFYGWVEQRLTLLARFNGLRG